MKTVLITGGSRGIGKEAVRAFCKKGYRTAFFYHASEAAAKALAQETGACAIRCNVADSAAVKEACREAQRVLSHIDVLVNNAAVDLFALFDLVSEQQAEELKNALSELNAQLEVVKSDLSDKVHSENVQCYRNLADILKSVEAKLDKANELEKQVNSVHKCAKAIIVLTVINMLGLVGLALYELGIFQMLLK